MSEKVKVVLIDAEDLPYYVLILAQKYYESYKKLLPSCYEIELDKEEWEDYRKIWSRFIEWQNKIGKMRKMIEEVKNGD